MKTQAALIMFLFFIIIGLSVKLWDDDLRLSKLEALQKDVADLKRTELQAHGVWTIRSFDPVNRAVTSFCMTDEALRHVNAAAFPMTWSNMDGAGFSNVPVGDKAWSGTFGLDCFVGERKK